MWCFSTKIYKVRKMLNILSSLLLMRFRQTVLLASPGSWPSPLFVLRLNTQASVLPRIGAFSANLQTKNSPADAETNRELFNMKKKNNNPRSSKNCIFWICFSSLLNKYFSVTALKQILKSYHVQGFFRSRNVLLCWELASWATSIT